jgi:hypothetical protein
LDKNNPTKPEIAKGTQQPIRVAASRNRNGQSNTRQQKLKTSTSEVRENCKSTRLKLEDSTQKNQSQSPQTRTSQIISKSVADSISAPAEGSSH